MTAYHATYQNHGQEFVFDRGGKYEKMRDDGTPIKRKFGGFAISDIRELAASKRPEAAIFAVTKNIINKTGDPSGNGPSEYVSVYQLERDPDIDCSNTVAGDFGINDEVRYRNPSENPVTGHRVHHIEVPSQVYQDVELAYLPSMFVGVSDVVHDWTIAVQQAIKSLLNGNQYPNDVATWADVKRPKRKEYEMEKQVRM